MNLKRLTYLIRSDLYRYHGNSGFGTLAKQLVLGCGFKYTFWMRVCKYLKSRHKAYLPVYVISRMMLRRYMSKYGLQISYTAEIGPGFYIGHFGQIVVNGEAQIGRNCNISQGVTIGMINRGDNAGVPVIGDNVYIAPGAKILGKVRIGNWVAIGANAVVTKDVLDNGVVVGVPGRVVSDKGSKGYINRIDYDNKAGG